jgi:four helix bundle protein
MLCAFTPSMKAKKLDDVLVYKKAVAAADEVSAMLERPVFRKDLDLKDQLSRSSGRVAPLIAEGFGQNTDRQMADYYGRARGSALESRGHLEKAMGREFISKEEGAALSGKYIEISKMLTPWINYLQRCNWKSRGVRPDDLPEPHEVVEEDHDSTKGAPPDR